MENWVPAADIVDDLRAVAPEHTDALVAALATMRTWLLRAPAESTARRHLVVMRLAARRADAKP